MKNKLFKNKRVTIMGLGLHGGGVGIAKFFVKEGAKVLVTDLKKRGQLKESIQKLKPFTFRSRKVKGINYVLGRHRKRDFANTDLVIKNPGVPNNSPYLKIAEKNGVAIDTDIGIFFELCKAPIIGVTGTKGKSTTATLIYNLIKPKYPKAVLAGNIGASPLESLKKIKKNNLVVLELSSWQLEGLKKHKKSPKIAVITNIYPDHLNRYQNLREYIEAKKLIFKFQKPSDILILNYNNPETRKLGYSTPSRVYFFSQRGKKTKPALDIKNLKLKGEHNISNLLAAVLTAKLLKVPSKTINNTLKKFKGLPGRQQYVAEIRKVKYFNDTTATIPEAAIEAIKTLSQRFPKAKIALIGGGENKGLDYKNLAKEISQKINSLILLPGTASEKMKRELKKIKAGIKVFPCSSMKEAVKKASGIASPDDIVLLSPAAASFNLFQNEFDRGEQFNKAVKNLKK